jgi:hypothetical protein
MTAKSDRYDVDWALGFREIHAVGDHSNQPPLALPRTLVGACRFGNLWTRGISPPHAKPPRCPYL